MRLILLFLLSYFQLSSQIDSLDYRIFNLDSRYDSFAYYVENQMGSPPDNVQYADYDSSILVIQYRPRIANLHYDKWQLIPFESANGIYTHRTKLTSFDLNGNIRWMKYLNLNAFDGYLPVIHLLDSTIYTMHIQRALIKNWNIFKYRKNHKDTVVLSCYRISDGQLLHQDSLIGLFDYPIYFYDSTYTTSIQEMRGDTVYRVEKNYGIRSHQLLAQQSLILRIDKHNNHKITLREALNEGEINSVIDREERFEGMNCVYTKYRDSVTIVDHKFQKLIPNQILQDSILAHYWIVSADKIGDSLVFCLLKRKMDLSNKERIKRIYKAEVLKLRAYEKEKRGYNKLDLDTELKKYYAEKKNEAMKWKKYRSDKNDSVFTIISYRNGKFRKINEIVVPISYSFKKLNTSILFINSTSDESLGSSSPYFGSLLLFDEISNEFSIKIKDTICLSGAYKYFYEKLNKLFLIYRIGNCFFEKGYGFISDQGINHLKVFDIKKHSPELCKEYKIIKVQKDLYQFLCENGSKYISVYNLNDPTAKLLLIEGKFYQVSGENLYSKVINYIPSIDNLSEIDQIRYVIDKQFNFKEK